MTTRARYKLHHIYRCRRCYEVCVSGVRLRVVAVHAASPGRPKARCGGSLKYEGPQRV